MGISCKDKPYGIFFLFVSLFVYSFYTGVLVFILSENFHLLPSLELRANDTADELKFPFIQESIGIVC